MKRYSRHTKNVADPYAFLALQVINQAFREIKCYYTRKGRKDEIIGGFEFLKWIQKMEGYFPLYAKVAAEIWGWPLDKFHQKCLKRINEIKKEAYERRNLAKKDKQS